jgi:hypothetical protein
LPAPKLSFLGGLPGLKTARQVGANGSEKHGPSMSMAAKAWWSAESAFGRGNSTDIA